MKLPWDKGDGRTSLAFGLPVVDVVVDVVTEDVVDAIDGRGAAEDEEVVEDDEPLR